MDRIEQLKVYARSLEDPIFAIETFLKTFDLTQKGNVPFKLFYKQKEIIRSYEKHNRNIVTKPRQAGVSTTTAAYIAVKTAFGDPDNPHKVLILANKQTLAQEFLKKVKDFLDQVPYWVWGLEEGTDYLEINSKGHIKLKSNGCEIRALATSKDALRGFTPTFLVMDEAAFIDNGSEVFGAALASLGTGGKISLISTPNGLDELYYKTYDGAKKKSNNFNIVEMKWYQDVRYNRNLYWKRGEDEKIICESIGRYKLRWEYLDKIYETDESTIEFYETMINDGWKPLSPWYVEMAADMGDAKKIAQELDVSFIGSGGNVIDDEFITYHEINNVIQPKFSAELEKAMWIWKEPEMGHKYILGCLPPNEKVLTNKGLKNIQDVDLTDMLINENGDYVGILNKQIYPVINEDIFEITVDNTFRKTTFTKEHPLLISKPILKRNYKKESEFYRFNERYWDFNFNYIRTEEVDVGDWVKVPNIYKKEIVDILDDKWVISKNIRKDFNINSPLRDKDFWWFIGMWLGDGWLGKLNESYTISVCFNSKEEYYLNKLKEIIIRLFDRSPSFIDKGNNTYVLIFNSKFLYYFMLENFNQYSHSKKISEWVKFIPIEFKKELLKGYFNSDGCWLKTKINGKINSKISFVSINLELLESIQDIIFSLGVISSLNKLRDSKEGFILGKLVNNKETYNLCLGNQDSLELLGLLNNDILDPKLNKFNIDEFSIINKRIIKSCHFSNDKDFIYFRIKNIKKNKFTGNVYNFECDTHTFMCHHITTHNCDVSRGDGKDSSTIVILDFENLEQVAEFQYKLPPDILAEVVYKYGNMYNAYTIVDITGGMGVATVLKLLEMDYKHLHYDDPKSRKLSEKYSKTKYQEGDKVPGFNVGNTRLQMVSELEEHIRENKTIIRSQRLISELRTFVYKNGRPDHMEGYHDDIIMAYAMCIFVVQTSFKKLQQLEKQTKAMLDSWVNVSSGTQVTQSQPGYVNPFYTNTPSYNPQQNNGTPNDGGEFNWLFGIK